jgi:hypothetical protein
MSGQVYAYDKEMDDFRLFATEQEWGDYIDIPGAISYLRNHLQKSIKDDFFPAYGIYKSNGVGFFALPRIVFPYITFLGTLFIGKDSSTNAITYMQKYLSKINPIYSDRDLCNFIYKVYRHGLAHTNMPKVVNEDGKIFVWRIVLDDKYHLNVDPVPNNNRTSSQIIGNRTILSNSPKKQADEVILSIDEYINDLQQENTSFEMFKEGFLSMADNSYNGIKIPGYIK